MSTVLKAAQELEKRAATGNPLGASSPLQEPGQRWPFILLAALVLLVSVTGSALFLRKRDALPSPDVSHRGSIGSQVALQQASPELRPPALAERAPGPWGRVEKKPSAAGEVAPMVRTVPPMAGAATQPANESKSPAHAARKESTREDDAVGSAFSPPGEPRVHVASIVYASNAAERLVTLRIGGGSSVTLREGDSASGIDVQLILRDSVYLRHGANIFAVSAAR